MTAAQQQAIDEHWPRFGVPYTDAALDLDRLFGRAAPKILEIGSGMGQATVAMAATNPDNDYLAVEVHRPGVGSLIRRAIAAGTDNIRVICHDVVDILRCQIPPASLDGVCVFFPDPWPKKRHHKRRLLNSGFLSLLVPALKDNGRLFLATDQEDLAEYMLRECDGWPGLINLAGNGQYAPRPRWRPLTKFEKTALLAGRGIRDLIYAPAGPSRSANEPSD
jgi:tRNA (guanine-N7-)-methyltransferase